MEFNKTERKERTKKIDVRSALSVIPPASQLFGEQKKPKERRIRLRFHDEVKEGQIVINPNLAKELEIKTEAEIVVAHRHRFVYNVILDDSVPETEVWVNGRKLPEYGISDNSIATIRAARRTIR